MTYRRGGEDGYFLLLAAPGFETKDKQVVLKDVAFVLDTSGSMAGKKLEQAKKALQFCLENLNEGDRFELVRFSTETEPLFDKMVEATPGNRARANEFIKNLKPTGGTAIDEALQKAFALRPGQSDRPYFVIFLTDGRPTVGNTDEDQIVAGVSRRAGSCRIFCFGIGTDVNTHLLDKITEVTKAVSQYVLPEEDLEVKVSNFFAKIKDPVLANVKIVFPEPMRMTKLYPSPLPDLFLGEQLLLVGRYSGQGEGQLVLEGTVNGRPQKFTAQTRFPEEASEHDFIPRLWATRRVGYLLDEIRLHGDNAELRDEVIELARKFGIVTPYTAYLIVEDEAQRNVPITARSLSSLHLDQDARRETAAAMEQFRTAKSGDSAVAGARYGLALRSATSAADAISLGNFEAQRGMYGGGAMPGIPAAQAQSVIGAATPVRVAQYLEQTRFVNGKNFFQNGNLWTDSQVQKLPQAKRVRIQFGSEQYFDLIAKNPAVSPWLALGQNVQFVLDGKVYEIYE
jgi:Ca-activated chloride channel family protein